MSHRVRIQGSNHEFIVEAGETVLDAALRQGILLPYGCRSGSCGACQGQVLAGRVHYGGPLPPALDQAEAAAGTALFCQALPETDLEIAVPEVESEAEIEVKQLPAKVTEIEHLAADVVRLRLKLPEAERLQFLAGQYIEILLKDGRRRAFSLANAPHDDETLELHIRLVPGGEFTRYVFEQMQPKTLLRIEGPFGSFHLREDSPRPILMLAGGTGFAPIKGMIEHAFHIGLERPIHLYWGARGRDDLYLDELARNWEATHPGFRYTPVLSEPQAADAWHGRSGLALDALLADHPDLSAHDIYMAGPPAMVEAARSALLGRGLPEEQLYCDAFEFAKDAQPAG
ncbi:CDP-6-deoxy-delta-3,4-glucoseen reductase [Thiohalobacter sp. IOR34]|uniref:CDP-6-deoxy-delta-3,4-glucoseen reductase n=1 Tax=Thiohalobacter sp. IOR34 TaxID=3057176 RepID=UPI0025AF8DF2|nr:CDP-6-deoxy-delta-3,4-glucoseen reductase [Thiohalobacter sp. IOR34]WJW75598.1 CDP-6-deoxy-delta-3,4-glucoseen reductase [Thiohalobacter sp. IOR34]